VDGVLYFDIVMDKDRQQAVAAEKAALLERHKARPEGPDRNTPRPGEEVVR
jgi:hypothetical protein